MEMGSRAAGDSRLGCRDGDIQVQGCGIGDDHRIWLVY
jgi:hypothetical protein